MITKNWPMMEHLKGVLALGNGEFENQFSKKANAREVGQEWGCLFDRSIIDSAFTNVIENILFLERNQINVYALTMSSMSLLFDQKDWGSFNDNDHKYNFRAFLETLKAS